MSKKALVFSLLGVLFLSGILSAESDTTAPEGVIQGTAAQTESYLNENNSFFQPEISMQAPDEAGISNNERFEDKSFIGSRNWRGDGSIVANRDYKYSLVTGDIIYTSLGSYEVKEGDICDVFRKVDKVVDPQTGKYLGYEIRYLGQIEIIGNIGIDSSLARVVSSLDTMKVGDQIKIISK